MTIIKFKRVKLTPDNIRLKKGGETKVERVIASGDFLEVHFEGDPTQGEIEAILRFLRQGQWEVES